MKFLRCAVKRAIGTAIALVLGTAISPMLAHAAGKDATGTWSGALAIGGVAQTLTVQLHQRDNDDLLGYVLAGTAGRTITGGTQTGPTVEFDLEIADPKLSRTISFSLVQSGNMLTGSALDTNTNEIQAIEWQAFNPQLIERRFLFAPAPGGEPGPPIELAIVRRAGNLMFVGGAFVSQTACEPFPCGGAVTDFEEAEDEFGDETIAIDLATGGTCVGTGSIEATFDPATKLYVGTYDITDCDNNVDTGDLIGAKTERTTSRHAAKMLDTFDQLASAIESAAETDEVLGPSDVPLSADYQHLGDTLADRLDEFNGEIIAYEVISVDFSRFRSLHTVEEPDRPAILGAALFGVDFHDRRTGTDFPAPPEVYRDVDTANGYDTLKFLNKEGADWLIYGNHIVHDLPFAAYSFVAGIDQVVVPTFGGDSIYVSVGPWGAHHGPHTGHIEGNAKADWFGYYARSLDQLDVLADMNGNGDCDFADDTCGLTGQYIEDRIIDYVAPAGPFEITEVFLESLVDPDSYFGNPEDWRVRGRTAYYTYDFVHIGEIAPLLRDAMVAAGYVDPYTVHAPSDNLITGAPIVLEAGDPFARPQVVAREILAFPGSYTGDFGVPETPYLQMEFFTRSEETGHDESYYTWLPTALRDQLASVLEEEGLNLDSFRYHQDFLVERRWKAEMALSNQDWSSRDDYSSLFSALGGWWENTAGACGGMPAKCDELFSIFPIRKDTAFYSAALYDSADVSYLAIHDETGTTRYGEVVDPSEPDPTAGKLIVKWRDFPGVVLGFQGLAYQLDTAGRILRIRWGSVVANQGLVNLPGIAIPDNDELCDGATVTCHTHDRPDS